MDRTIYLIRSKENGYYKIGISKNPQKRLKQLQTGNASELEIIHLYKTEYASKIEKTLHNLYSHNRLEGEWFDLSIVEALNIKEQIKKIENNFKLIYESQKSI